jgi:AcrR family transcriptional regulator
MAKKSSNPVAAETSGPRSARDRLLAAANELFYDEGIHTVGIDRVIERAGVAKASLYSAFGSKDELVRAYLLERRDARQQRILARIARHDAPRAQILAVFELLGELAADPRFRGCAFQRASAEGQPGKRVQNVCDESRAWTRGLFTDLARAAGVESAEALALKLHILYDGVSVAAQMDGGPDAARAARSAAETLIDAALAA